MTYIKFYFYLYLYIYVEICTLKIFPINHLQYHQIMSDQTHN